MHRSRPLPLLFTLALSTTPALACTDDASDEDTLGGEDTRGDEDTLGDEGTSDDATSDTDTESSESDESSESSESDTDTSMEESGETEQALSFAVDVYPIFVDGCSCHVSNSPGDLPMPNAQVAFDNLVDVASKQAPGVARVVPGDSQNSYMVQKLMDTQGRGNGKSMPPADAPNGPLSAAEQALLVDWVDQGAAP